MKKIYSKKQLARIILEYNPDIFIPLDSLVADLNNIYKVKKIAIKILNNIEYDQVLLKNLVITANNIFGNSCYNLYMILMTD
mgnify:FL=1